MVILAVSPATNFPLAAQVSLVQLLTFSLIGPSNCTDFVANNPDEFVNAYWEVGTFQIYTAS